MRGDGTDAHVVARTLNLQGAPAWSPDGLSIVSAADDHGVSHLFRVPVSGGAPETLIREYSMDPAWSLGGRFLVYSGPDIGTNFSVQAVAADAKMRPLPALTLTRGARHLAFLPNGHELAFLRGDMQHRDLWPTSKPAWSESLSICRPTSMLLTSTFRLTVMKLCSKDCRKIRVSCYSI